MLYRILIFLILIGVGLSIIYEKNKPQITVLTYSSFAGVYGAGKILKKQFEKKCNCKVKFLIASNSSEILQRLHMKIPIDVVIGFDQMTLAQAKKFSWKDLSKIKLNLISYPKLFSNRFFKPLNWSPIGWFYKKDTLKSVTSLEDLTELPKNISFPEPQFSTLGKQFYYWIYNHFQGDTEKIKKYLKKLKLKTYRSIPSWSMAYGLFQKNYVDMSLSYLSSLIFHSRNDLKGEYKFAVFKAQPYQVEFVAIPQSAKNPDLAFKFVSFLFEKSSQHILMKKNYMFPVIQSIRPSYLEEFFNKKQLKLLKYTDLNKFLSNEFKLLKLWNDIFK